MNQVDLDNLREVLWQLYMMRRDGHDLNSDGKKALIDLLGHENGERAKFIRGY